MASLYPGETKEIHQQIPVSEPELWSVDHPYLYKSLIQVIIDNKIADEYVTNFGIRYFTFDPREGLSLNGNKIRLFGVCQHHDLGALGTAINTRALERQLEILQQMGCNAIRTSHNPPAPELLDLCDRMGLPW